VLLLLLLLLRCVCCRLWGKIFERASAVKDFDAASITAFLWAATAAGEVGQGCGTLRANGVRQQGMCM
jgi:hypothetical protein